MVFPLLSRSASPLISIFISIVILLLHDADLVKGDLIPPIGLSPGATYQIIFVTADPMAATSPDIGAYNAFVGLQASALNSFLPSGVTWYALASTEATDARSNAVLAGGGEDDIPIYNTHGELIANGISDLWGSDINFKIQHAVTYNQFNTTLCDSMVWTGSQLDGAMKTISGSIIGPLGSSYPMTYDS